MSFVHLHTHTEYSLLDGMNRVKDYVARVKELGMTAAAITDHGEMFGVIEFYKACREEGINPVIGCEVYVAPGSRFEKKTGRADSEIARYFHLILLAENNVGYHNLIKLVSRGYTEGFYYKPRIDFELLKEYHEGLICLSACVAGEVPRLLAAGMYDEAKATAIRYRDLFGKDNYFLELQDHGMAIQKKINPQLIRISEETGIGLVVTNDCHYTYAKDAEAHDVLICIQTQQKLHDENRSMTYEGGQYYVKSEEEMRTVFPYADEAIQNTQRIADRCHVTIEFGEPHLPHYEVPEEFSDAWEYLNHLCSEGLTWRYPGREDELRGQLEYELSIIRQMGFVDYFLVVWDYVNFARRQDIVVGPGRGSASGSIVSYVLGITDIDPVKYALVFERFLNPERVSMPDIDVDFDAGRERVIEYVIDKYGHDNVTQIITFGTLKARNAVRDVGRVMDLDYSYVDRISKSIPRSDGEGHSISLKTALTMNPELQEKYDTDPTAKELIDMAMRLEGLPRNSGVHPAGVVIAEHPMDEYVPLALGKGDAVITQYEAAPMEELGLLKMDFLGLITLTMISDAINQIRENHGKNIVFTEMTYDDPKVFETIASGDTTGVFQLEGAGMTRFMISLKPESLEDIIAGIALYRPGPMQSIPVYVKAKNSGEKPQYLTEKLRPILEPTYGCIIYQEQVLQIFRELAGYSMGQADEIRRAMSKKKQAIIDKERQAFIHGDPKRNISGCEANGIEMSVADSIYDQMEEFAKYAFNKAHAASYAVLGYQTGYLKCYYPKEFFCALLTSELGNAEKVAHYIRVVRSRGIEVLPPDVNKGKGAFAVDGDAIRYGMYSIKGVGENVIDAVVEEREQHGQYKSLEDFLRRVTGIDKGVNKKAIESMIKAGALDGLDGNRRQKIYIYQQILDSLANDKKKNYAGQMTLLDLASDEDKEEFKITLPDVPEFDRETRLSFEKEVMGIYVSGHPLEDDIPLMESCVTAVSADFIVQNEEDDVEDDSADANVIMEAEEEKVHDGEQVVIGGLLIEKEVSFSKKNNLPWAKLIIEDLYGTMEVLVFSKQYERLKDKLVEDSKVFVAGRVHTESDKNSCVYGNNVIPFDEVPREVWLRFENKKVYEPIEKDLISDIADLDGDDSLVIYLNEEKAKKRFSDRYDFKATDGLLERWRGLYGDDSVAIKPKKLSLH